MKNKLNINNGLISEVSKRRGIETAGFGGTLSKTNFDKCFIYNLASIKEEAFVLSVASSTRIEGSTKSNDEVRQMIINGRINKIAARLINKNEESLAMFMAYKPGVSIMEMLNASPFGITLRRVENIVSGMLNRNLIIESGIGYKINA